MTTTKDRLLTPGEVAALFRVDPKTVTRWAKAGKISRIRTVGGHGRFLESQILALLKSEGIETPDDLIPEPRTPATVQPATVAPGRVPAMRDSDR